jgi:hypothetical protein
MRRRDYRPNKQRPREQSYRWAESLDRSSLIKSAEVTHGRGQFLQKNLNAALRVQRTLEAKITVLQSERAAVKAEYQRTHPLRTLVVTKLTGKSKGLDNNLQEQIRKIQLKKYKFEGKEFSISELVTFTFKLSFFIKNRWRFKSDRELGKGKRDNPCGRSQGGRKGTESEGEGRKSSATSCPSCRKTRKATKVGGDN